LLILLPLLFFTIFGNKVGSLLPSLLPSFSTYNRGFKAQKKIWQQKQQVLVVRKKDELCGFTFS
jgi:hypothetical protein